MKPDEAGSFGRSLLKIRVGKAVEAAERKTPPAPPIEERKTPPASPIAESKTPPASPKLPPTMLIAKKEIHCEFCGKIFDNGKAYGGHKSAHVQTSKNSSNNKKQNSKNSGEYACTECDKVFASEKSLHGHMRCHPERNWRGMEPPNSRVQSPDANSEVLITHAGEGSSKSPPEKKRKSSGSNSDAGAEEELRDFNSDSRSTSPVGKKKKSPDSDAGKVRARAEFKNLETGRVRARAELGNWETGSTSTSPISIDLDDERVRGALDVLANGMGKKMSLDGQKGEHKCITCGKVFATHQALGGHRSSHNKFKMVIVNGDDLQLSNIRTSGRRRSRISHSTATPAMEKDADAAENCRINQSTAATPSVEEAAAEKAALISHSTAATPAMEEDTAEKAPMFDLNEMPEEEDKDGDADSS